jgi:hypothetical protein
MKINKISNIFEPNIFYETTINEALDEIKTKKYEKQINALRKAKVISENSYKAQKNKLPAWTFNGCFNDSIKNDNFVASSGFFHFDIDHIDDVEKNKELLIQLPSVYAVWVSPGGDGIKGLMRIKPDSISHDDDFKSLFEQARSYLRQHGFMIDVACKDVRRLCFVCSDESILIDDDAVAFVPDKPKTTIPQANPVSSADTCLHRVENIMRQCAKGNCHNTRLRAGMLAGGFIAGGLVDENIITQHLLQLSDYVSSQFGDNTKIIKKEHKAILSAIERGKASPITNQYTNNYPQTTIKSASVPFIDDIDRNSLAVRMSKTVAHACWLPEQSVFLIGLAVFSAITSRCYKNNYKHHGSLPLGSYTIAEQPSGASKSRCLNTYQKPFMDIYYEQIEQWKLECAQQVNEEDMPPKPLSPFVTNTTPEALEESLNISNGFFAACSSEQGLTDSILGGIYGDNNKPKNNDIVLNGFDAGYVCNMRVSRKAYSGHVIGTVALISQPGSIENLVGQSNGTGLAERFLLLSERHQLGQRNFNEERFMSLNILDEYNNLVRNVHDKIKDRYDDLIELNISAAGHDLIADFRNELEPLLADGARLSNVTIRGAAAKIDMQIMKIAGNLHLFAGLDESVEISADTIAQSIVIARFLLRENLMLLESKGLSGATAEYESILSMFENNPAPRAENIIINNKIRTKIFKEKSLPDGVSISSYVRSVLEDMYKKGYINRRVRPADDVIEYYP